MLSQSCQELLENLIDRIIGSAVQQGQNIEIVLLAALHLMQSFKVLIEKLLFWCFSLKQQINYKG